MNGFLTGLSSVVDFLNGIVWSDWLVYALFAAALLFSVVAKFPQIRLFGPMCKYSFSKGGTVEGISPLQSFLLTVGARVGTGNIVGVAAAIAFGGPGSIFWMWLLALLGAATSFFECTLSQIYKEEVDGEYYGGTSYFIARGLKCKWFALLFAIVAALVNGFAYAGIHANAISSSFDLTFHVSPTVTGIILVVLVGIICFGGIRRIVKASEVLVPFMAIGYMLIALIVTFANIGRLPEVIGTIFASAFGGTAMFGGLIGSAISWGVQRGVYSNEAGLGTCTNAAAAAEVSHPVKQGLVQAFSVYVDTLLVCSATAFMILLTNSYNVFGSDGVAIVENLPGVEEGSAYAITAVGSVFGHLGGIFVTVALTLFAFTSLIAGYYNGEANVVYAFKNEKARKIGILVIRIMTMATTLYGTQVATSVVWSLTDLGCGLMAWMNLLACVLLVGVGIKAMKDFDRQRRAGLDPVFDPDEAGIQNADIWREIKKKYLRA